VKGEGEDERRERLGRARRRDEWWLGKDRSEGSRSLQIWLELALRSSPSSLERYGTAPSWLKRHLEQEHKADRDKHVLLVLLLSEPSRSPRARDLLPPFLTSPYTKHV
jgi:hypothetical protein